MVAAKYFYFFFFLLYEAKVCHLCHPFEGTSHQVAPEFGWQTSPHAALSRSRLVLLCGGGC